MGTPHPILLMMKFGHGTQGILFREILISGRGGAEGGGGEGILFYSYVKGSTFLTSRYKRIFFAACFLGIQ